MAKEKMPVQKGPIESNWKTYKNATHTEKMAAREEELRGLRSGITPSMHMPKK